MQAMANKAAGKTLSFSVVVPTYQRPQYLKKCLQSVVSQTYKPNQVCVVSRATDVLTHEAFSEFKISQEQCLSDITLVLVKIQQAGFLPPIQAGINAARCDIAVFIDDDAEAYPDWLENIEKVYTDEQVGGVGGRVLNIYDGVERRYKPAKVFGKFYWYGRLEGNLYKDGAGDRPIDVDCLMGGNMSYRKSALDQISIDMQMNNAVASNYEVDLGLQVKEKGYRLVYNPLAKVNHFSAGATGDSPRKDAKETFYWSSFNLGYLLAKHTRGFRLFCILAYYIFIGQTMAWGVLSAFWFVVRYKKSPPYILESILGRYAGIKAALRIYGSNHMLRLGVLLKVNIQSLRYGFIFGRGESFRLPRNIRLQGKFVPIDFPGEEGIRVAFADIFLHDCYGLSRLRRNHIKTILDIGGNVGMFGLAARAQFPLAKIHSYEPNKRLMAHLKHNATVGTFEFFEEAVGYTDGRVLMNDVDDSVLGTVRDNTYGDVKKTAFKKTIERLGGAVDLVKMDCEGSEWEILADHESWKMVRFITSEYHLLHQYEHDDIIKKLNHLGFKVTRQITTLSCGIVWAERNDQE